jgi:hypothetical protein
VLEVVSDDFDARRSSEPTPKLVQHVGRKVQSNTDSLWPSAQNEVQQSTVSRTKVEDPGYAGRNFFEQRGLSGRSMRHSIGSFEIAGRMLR